MICSVTILHHLLVLFFSRIDTDVADVILTILEFLGFICVLVLSFSIVGGHGPGFPGHPLIPAHPLMRPLLGVDAALLCLSQLFLLVGKSRGRFDFYGGAKSHLHYNPWQILFGRSQSRPLVRGESRTIIIIRTGLLCGLCVVIPFYGVYSTIVWPIQSKTFTREIKISRSWNPSRAYATEWTGPIENITIVLYSTILDYSQPPPTTNVTVCGTLTVVPGFLFPGATRSGPFSWPSLQNSATEIVLSANASDSRGILYVKPGQGDAADVDEYTEAIPLMPGSHLSAVLSVTERQLFLKGALDFLGFTTPLRSILVYTALLIQTDPSPPNSGSDTISLRLRLRDDVPGVTAIVQDYTDASVLAGLSDLGGFWALMNGVFALLFGANLLYFLFGRRPLSALGIMHVFQRRGLIRQWHEDFPALYTEGGRPGSDVAGIVAFIRERLVDLDDENNPPQDQDNQGIPLESVYQPVDIREEAEWKGVAEPVQPGAMRREGGDDHVQS
ncbi:hypothetical protein FB451DRAFT_1264655 [Mycena latifolia]|nr:hypothetical protein FB451DRAFT_1264655 [Mycena latifolia]